MSLSYLAANCVSDGNLAPDDGRAGGGVSFDSVDGSDAEVGVRSLVVDMAVEVVSAAVVETKMQRVLERRRRWQNVPGAR
jgi:hypothetical protein